MPDAGTTAPAKTKAVAKTSKAGSSAEAGSDGKKRFEVKKVRLAPLRAGDDLMFCSGTRWRSGLGILLSTTVLSAGITSWIFVHSPLSFYNTFH